MTELQQTETLTVLKFDKEYATMQWDTQVFISNMVLLLIHYYQQWCLENAHYTIVAQWYRLEWKYSEAC